MKINNPPADIGVNALGGYICQPEIRVEIVHEG